MALKILVVDDDPDIRQFIREALESEGHETLEAATAAGALMAMERGPLPDVVLLDLGIPGGGGIGVLKAVKRHPEWQSARILFMSGSLDVAATAAAHGAHGVLEKPFSFETLFSRVLEAHNKRPPRSSEFLSPHEARLFFTQAPFGIAVLQGPEHTYRFVNPCFMTMCFGGRPPSDLLDKTMRQAMPELQGQGFYEILDTVYRTGKSFQGAKLRVSIVQPGGVEKEMFVNFTYQAKLNEEGRIDGIFVFVYEVTDQVNEQREIELLADHLRTALLSRDTFLGIASHELNTPLTSLKLQIQMSQRLLERQGAEAFPEERIVRLLAHVGMQVDRLSGLVNDMLDVSRIGFKKMSVHKVRTNISRLVADVFARAELQLELAGCKLNLNLAPEVFAQADPARIEQVLTNFMTNALKYAPGRPLHVSVLCAGKRVRVSVRDEGMGVPVDAQERIFDRFERAVGPNAVSGLGLGLYISKEIIQEHGGEIGVESEPGKGATFTFELPSLELEETVSLAPP
ncbi:MAG: response regulator [Silvanigrellales bacterium]|nr:response regulator [Silvanigrellales bacterium]